MRVPVSFALQEVILCKIPQGCLFSFDSFICSESRFFLLFRSNCLTLETFLLYAPCVPARLPFVWVYRHKFPCAYCVMSVTETFLFQSDQFEQGLHVLLRSAWAAAKPTFPCFVFHLLPKAQVRLSLCTTDHDGVGFVPCDGLCTANRPNRRKPSCYPWNQVGVRWGREKGGKWDMMRTNETWCARMTKQIF